MRKASVELRVAFADLDGMRAVYHTNYIRWFDLARTKLFREAGFSMEKWEGGGILLPLVVCHCEYREGAVFDDPLRVTAQIAEVRGKVVTIEYGFLPGGGEGRSLYAGSHAGLLLPSAVL